jgi:multisubunit Na+/H+ antiporter MnhC subunit
MKQSGDTTTLVIGAGLVAFGLVQCVSGYYKLATGKGKYA